MSAATDYARFRRAAVKWQRRFGLLDWRLTFQAVKIEPNYGATIRIGIEERQAIVSYNTRRQTDHSIEKLALHEMLHLLLADHGATAALRGDRLHADAMLEEHRLIERLICVLL